MAILFLSTLLAGCVPGDAALPEVTQPPMLAQPSPTATQAAAPLVSPTPTSTVSPTPAPVPSPTQANRPQTCGEGWCTYPGHFFFSRPVAGVYGRQVDPTYRYASTNGGKRVPHTGVEFQAPEGNQVFAAGDGTVVQAGAELVAPFAALGDEYGNLVIIRHLLDGYPAPVYSMYGHLSQIEVSLGQSVHSGEEIGRVGDTGAATGPHLHFEVRVGNEPLPGTRNPELWLKPDSQDDLHPGGAIAGRIAGPDGSPLCSRTVALQRLPAAGETTPMPVFLLTYDTDQFPVDDLWQENFAAGDLPSGTYRVSVIANGEMDTRTVQILPGQVTVVTFDDHPLPNQSTAGR